MFVGEIDLFYIFDLVLGEVAVAVFVIFVWYMVPKIRTREMVNVNRYLLRPLRHRPGRGDGGGDGGCED